MAKEKTNQLQRWWGSLATWIHHHKKAAIIGGIAAICLIVAAGMVAFALFYQRPIKDTTPPPKPKPAAAPVVYYSPLTGEKVATEADSKKSITGVIIENSPDARPQSGLASAETVYEAVAEGGITRFLALYQTEKPQLIGPVRSLRPYYIDWLAPYDASIAHVGGSRKALDTIRDGSHRDLDQMLHDNSYWRTTDRQAPHNVYTSFEKLDALNNEKKYTASHAKTIPRIDSVKKPVTVPHINVTISGPWYNSTWDYQEDQGVYTRGQNGAAHTDRENGQITASAIVILKQTMETGWEDGPREFYQTTGDGDAVVFQNGEAQEAKWHKPAMNDQFNITTQDGQTLPLVRGKVWFTAVPVNQGGGVSW